MISAIGDRDGRKIGQLLYNDLEKVALPAYPQVAQLRDAFEKTDILGVMMSGSGADSLCPRRVSRKSSTSNGNCQKYSQSSRFRFLGRSVKPHWHSIG